MLICVLYYTPYKRNYMNLKTNLFERVESGKGLFAVETISLIYNALTSILILLLYTRMDHPGTMLLERAGIVVLTFTLIFLYQAFPCRLTAFVRMVVQMSLLAYWYPDTFAKLCPSIWFSEPFNMGYFFYYPMMLIVVVYYFVKRFEWFEKICFVLVTSFFIYYFIYIMLPVAGPQFYFPAIGMDKVNACDFPAIGDYFNTNDYLIPGPDFDQGFFFNLVEASQEVGERPTAAFPSSHVGISTIVMIMAWRVSKRLAYILLPFYVLLCCATVYIQAHYLIDSLVGFFSAFFVYQLATLMYKRWFITPAFKLMG